MIQLLETAEDCETYGGADICLHIDIYIYRWWFQIFLIFTLTWGNDPI